MARTKIEVVQELFRAWGRHDVDTIIGLMAADVEWHYHVGSPPVNGVDAMRKVLDRLKNHQIDSTWRLTRHAETGNALLVEGVDDFESAAGHRVQVPYMGVYEFDGEAITSWRDYVDLGLLTAAQAGEALGDHLRPLIDAGVPINEQ